MVTVSGSGALVLGLGQLVKRMPDTSDAWVGVAQFPIYGIVLSVPVIWWMRETRHFERLKAERSRVLDWSLLWTPFRGELFKLLLIVSILKSVIAGGVMATVASVTHNFAILGVYAILRVATMELFLSACRVTTSAWTDLFMTLFAAAVTWNLSLLMRMTDMTLSFVLIAVAIVVSLVLPLYALLPETKGRRLARRHCFAAPRTRFFVSTPLPAHRASMSSRRSSIAAARLRNGRRR